MNKLLTTLVAAAFAGTTLTAVAADAPKSAPAATTTAPAADASKGMSKADKKAEAKAKRRWPAAADSKLTVTTIKLDGIWHGTASGEAKRYLWYYEPRGFLHLMEQDDINPRAWMYVSPIFLIRSPTRSCRWNRGDLSESPAPRAMR